MASIGQQVPHGAKCVCTICNCGTHKCVPGKHHHVPYDPDALASTYGKHFPGHAGHAVQRPQRTRELHTSMLPFDGATTNQVDFKGTRGAAAQPYKPAQGVAGGPEDRDFKTEARSTLTEKGLHKRESYAPRGAMIGGLPFDGQSTHSADFVAHPGVRPPAPYRMRDSGLNAGPDTRDFTSENHGHFTDKSHGIVPARARAPASRLAPLPFDGQSTHSQDFRGVAGAPARAYKPERSAAGGPEDRDFVTESRLKHSDKGVQPRVAMRSMHTIRPSLPFDGKSTTSVDFPGWEGLHAAASARPARGTHTGGVDDRDFRSESAKQFGAKPLPPRGGRLGPAPWRPSADDRDFTTEQKGNMGDKGYQKRASFRPSQELHVAGAPFDGASTTASDFREPPAGTRAVRARAPASGLVGRPEDRDFVTDAASNYVPKEKQVCPAVELPTRVAAEPGGHAYFGKRETGRWTPIAHLTARA